MPIMIDRDSESWYSDVDAGVIALEISVQNGSFLDQSAPVMDGGEARIYVMAGLMRRPQSSHTSLPWWKENYFLVINLAESWLNFSSTCLFSSLFFNNVDVNPGIRIKCFPGNCDYLALASILLLENKLILAWSMKTGYEMIRFKIHKK